MVIHNRLNKRLLFFVFIFSVQKLLPVTEEETFTLRQVKDPYFAFECITREMKRIMRATENVRKRMLK